LQQHGGPDRIELQRVTIDHRNGVHETIVIGRRLKLDDTGVGDRLRGN
jgi:hypothetical protein